ncbi:uncharacterized protein RSE6_09645 [Rhynchosporium secalis]|uniref:C2H2-type domain-containing protein n=1 Tax=Rhynchosporium secalis TaxID=38038 RepID=A0A1E1MIG3_RHYSE|nr:uncharacterized protein RSE6_09645 [Rhynchosporium secalis]
MDHPMPGTRDSDNNDSEPQDDTALRIEEFMASADGQEWAAQDQSQKVLENISEDQNMDWDASWYMQNADSHSGSAPDLDESWAGVDSANLAFENERRQSASFSARQNSNGDSGDNFQTEHSPQDFSGFGDGQTSRDVNGDSSDNFQTEHSPQDFSGVGDGQDMIEARWGAIDSSQFLPNFGNEHDQSVTGEHHYGSGMRAPSTGYEQYTFVSQNPSPRIPEPDLNASRSMTETRRPSQHFPNYKLGLSMNSNSNHAWNPQDPSHFHSSLSSPYSMIDDDGRNSYMQEPPPNMFPGSERPRARLDASQYRQMIDQNRGYITAQQQPMNVNTSRDVVLHGTLQFPPKGLGESILNQKWVPPIPLEEAGYFGPSAETIEGADDGAFLGNWNSDGMTWKTEAVSSKPWDLREPPAQWPVYRRDPRYHIAYTDSGRLARPHPRFSRPQVYNHDAMRWNEDEYTSKDNPLNKQGIFENLRGNQYPAHQQIHRQDDSSSYFPSSTWRRSGADQQFNRQEDASSYFPSNTRKRAGEQMLHHPVPFRQFGTQQQHPRRQQTDFFTQPPQPRHFSPAPPPRQTYTGLPSPLPFLPTPPPTRPRPAQSPQPSIPLSSLIFTGQLPGSCPHPCPDCFLSFTTRSTLKTHSLFHDPEKMFVCNIPNCNSRFKDSAKLIIHLRGHQGQICCGGRGVGRGRGEGEGEEVGKKGCGRYFMNFQALRGHRGRECGK